MHQIRVLLTAAMLMPVPMLMLTGCSHEAEPAATGSAAGTAQAPGGAMPEHAEDADERARATPSDPAELPERFAAMVAADAASPGREGIGQAQAVFHELLGAHERITRTIEDLPDGVRTTTTSDDPQVAALIRLHVRQMYARFGAGMPVRRWDPLFAELVARYRSIDMVYQDVPGGITVTQTSEDPQVVLLIRQHAHRAVSEFVARGFDRAGEPTPLPEGYAAPAASPPPPPAGPG